MIIAIPIDENKEDVCVSFGRTPYFLFYNTETQKTDIALNAAAQAQGGAGIKAAQLVADQNADAVITVRLGQNAADVLQSGDIKIYKSMEGSALENIKAMVAGKLNILESFHAGFHGQA